MTKYIFVTGGVVSGIGKGITAASLASLLKTGGFKIFMQKLDPYLNVDPGTMNPYQHGEVFVTSDGAETDLDLGHYERFIDVNLNNTSSVTSGKIYQSILSKERKGFFQGSTVQVVPHVTNEIKNRIYQAAKDNKADIMFIEVGGTIGDIESLPFIESIRQMKNEVGSKNILFLHVALVPFLKSSKEFKTKPIQHSIKELLSYGVQPDIIVARSENVLSKKTIDKIALFCNVSNKNILNSVNASSIYEVPLGMYKQNAHQLIIDTLDLKPKKNISIDNWVKFNSKIKNSKKEISVDIVGKYIELPDSYLSVVESLNIAGFENKTKVNINWVNSEEINADNYKTIFKNSSGILIPGGFGTRGIAGKILAAKYARENKVPFLGICLGMQVSIIEFAINVLGLKEANSTEIDKNTPDPVFDIIVKKDESLGGTLHLGAYDINVEPDTLAYQLFGKVVTGRHRHRFEFNNKYKTVFEKHGLKFSGLYPKRNMQEIVELPNHPFFIGFQFHPEFTSRPNKPNKAFDGFVKAILSTKQ